MFKKIFIPIILHSDTYCVISATFRRVQIFISGNRLSAGFLACDTFVLIKSVTINATKYVDIFGVILKSSRT